MESPNKDQEKTVTNTDKKKSKQKWSLKKKILVIVGVVIALFIVIFVTASMATSAPLKVSDEFITDIQAGKASAAYDLMSSDAQLKTSSQDFTAMVDQMSPILTGVPKNTSKEVSAETGSDPSAKIVYDVTGSDNYTHVLTVNLVQVDGQWKVLNFESVKQ